MIEGTVFGRCAVAFPVGNFGPTANPSTEMIYPPPAFSFLCLNFSFKRIHGYYGTHSMDLDICHQLACTKKRPQVPVLAVHVRTEICYIWSAR